MARAVPGFKYSTLYNEVEQDGTLCEFAVDETAGVSTDQDPCGTHRAPQ